MKVLVTSNSFGKYSKDPLNKLIDAGFDVIFNPYHRMMSEEEFINEVKDVDAVILSTEVMNKNVIDHAKKLKMISRYGVGLDTIDITYCKEKNIHVTTTKNANSNAVAEYAIALMFAAMRGVCISASYAKQNVWKKVTGIDITGKTIGIIGLGSIGKEVAKKLSSFDTTILAYDVYYDEGFIHTYNIHKASLEDIILQSDIITLHAPASDHNAIISYDEVEKMKENVVLINTARSSLIDTDAMLHYLDNGKIYAVALDVHPEEPNFDKRFLKYDNVILTPHNAAISKEATDKTSMMAVDHIISYFEEQKEIKGVTI